MLLSRFTTEGQWLTPVVQPCFGLMAMSGVWGLTITHAASAHNTTHSRLKHVPCYSMTAPAWRVTGAVELASSGKDKTGQHEGRRRGSCNAGMNRSWSALLAERLSTAHVNLNGQVWADSLYLSVWWSSVSISDDALCRRDKRPV